MGHFKQSLEMPKKSFPYQSGATVINGIIGWKIPKFHQASECYVSLSAFDGSVEISGQS